MSLEDLPDSTTPAPAPALWRSALANATASGIAKLAAFLMVVIVSQSLPPPQAGRLFLGLAIASVLAMVTRLGLPEVLTREVPSLDAKGRSASANALAHKGIALSILLAGVVCVLAFALSASGPLDSVVLPAALAGGFLGIQSVAIGLAQARGRILLAESPYPVVSSVFLTVLAIVLIGGTISGENAMWLRASLEILAAAVVVAIVLLSTPRDGALAPPIREVARFAVPFWLTAFSWLVIQQSDVLVLGWLGGNRAVGTYVPILRSLDMTLLPLMALGAYVLPLASRLVANARADKVQDLYAVTTKVAYCASIPVVTAFFIAPEQIVGTVFGITAPDVPAIARILAVAYWINLALGVNGVILKAVAPPQVVLIPSGIILVACPLANLLLVPQFGVIGAALGTLFSYAALNLINSIILYRSAGISPFRGRVPVTLLVGLLGVVAAWWLRVTLDFSLVPNLALSVIVGLLSLGTAWRTTSPASRRLVMGREQSMTHDSPGDKGEASPAKPPPPGKELHGPSSIVFLGWVGSNFGDNVMLEFATGLLGEAVDDSVEKRVISLDPRPPRKSIRQLVDSWLTLEHTSFPRLMLAVARADAVILVGGEDLHLSRRVGVLMRTARASGSPVILLSIGQSHSRKVPRWMRRASVAVRDEGTLTYIREACPQAVLLGDSVGRLVLDSPAQHQEVDRIATNLRLPITVPGVDSAYDPAAWFKLLEKRAQDLGADVDLLVADPDDVTALQPLQQKLEETGRVIARIVPVMTVRDWMALPRYRWALATRLHIGMALAAIGVDVEQISYATKVRAVLREGGKLHFSADPKTSPTAMSPRRPADGAFFSAGRQQWLSFLRSALSYESARSDRQFSDSTESRK